MMEMSSMIDATLTFVGVVTTFAMGIWGLSSASTTVSTPSADTPHGWTTGEVPTAA